MKSFFIFLAISFLLIGSFIYYNLKHPSDTMIVRQGAYWNIFEHNITKEKR